MSDIEVVLLGNRGSGKTTLLASMSTELDNCRASLHPLRLEPTDGEWRLLSKRWKAEIDRLDKEYSLTAQYAGTAEIIRHPFLFTNGEEKLSFNFVDTPGGKTEDASLIDVVSNASALICIVDAVELMEFSTAKARINCAEAGILRLLGKATEDRPMTCLFVLTKCEKYMHSSIPSENAEALAKKFTECFSPVLELENLTSFYLPVETLGCFEFAGFEGEGEDRMYNWRRCARDIKPVNLLIPLCFAMIELLEKLKDQESIWKKIWHWFFDDEDYRNYLIQLLRLTGEATWFCGYNSQTKKLENIPELLNEMFEELEQDE